MGMMDRFRRFFARRAASPQQHPAALAAGPFSRADMERAVAGRMDGWGNVITGLLTARDKRMGAFSSFEPMPDDETRDLWRGDWLAKRIIELYPKEVMRRGYKIKLEDDVELAQSVHRYSEKLKYDQIVTMALMMRRAYGGAAIFPVIDGAQSDLRDELDKTAIREIKAFHLLEPRELVPTSWYTDLQNPKFGQPERYIFVPLMAGSMPANQQLVEIHESRLIVFQGVKVTRLHQAGNRLGWGDNVLTPCGEVMKDYGMSWGAAAALIQDFSQAVLKLAGLANLMVQDQDTAARNRIAQIDMIRSFMRMVVIDKEDEFDRKQTPVTGLVDLLREFSTVVAAAADMPVTVLMGMSPAGLNATGESDRTFFYDRTAAQQTDATPQVQQGLELVMAASDGPCKGEIPDEWALEWLPLWNPSDKEIAETRWLHAQADTAYVDSGVLMPEEPRSRWQGDKYSNDITLDHDAFEAQQNLDPVLSPADLAALNGQPIPPDDGIGQPVEGGGDPAAKPQPARSAIGAKPPIAPANGVRRVPVKQHERTIPSRNG